ncbi:intraflagellar transport protein 22 homolog isoform X3 [Choristoneura fumiferana]|uniref:intraflagellar transport protein 22 homolog isoform X3 n=1 Tax=Choristoneura fumiferana TaxID=7141 RepID=UPI003D15D00C
MHLNKLKILLIGPSASGKSLIANFISESTNIEEAGAPKATQGVRIVEFELSNINVNDKIYNNDIELWDCSGDHRFESCWPALRVGVQGVILPKLSSKQCVLFYNCTDEQDDLESLNLSPTFSKVSQVIINLKTGGSRLKIDFSNFVVSILQTIN